MSATRPHPYVPFNDEPGATCDHCGEKESNLDEHPPGLKLYRIEWRAVVSGNDEEWGRSAAEARSVFLGG